MPKLLILGAGGQGRVAGEIAELMGCWKDIAYLDDNAGLTSVDGFPVIGRLSDYQGLKHQFSHAFAAFGHNQLRMEWIAALTAAGFEIPALIHPQSVVSRRTAVGAGTLVMAGAVVNPNARIGAGGILNTQCSVDHDCLLEDGVHISPGAHLGGGVQVGRLTWICIGASVSNHLIIGAGSIIAAGAAVVQDIPDCVLAAGVPAQIKKKLI
ncbi:acetyltransferase [Paenibacillus pinistramenti]|uniref:acetyltransferase n=1 Tax=Paenibacillus pinistramenti TaxID=1768003 RepID=UPI00193994D3|nr:acetyltransferase [Paenibacillus pinistramenti]